MSKFISIKNYVEVQKEELKSEIESLPLKPCLAVVQIDNDPASASYVKGKKRDAEELGISFIHVPIDSEQCTQEQLIATIMELDDAPTISGIIIQLPIPQKYDLDVLQKCIRPTKDVDGFRKDSLHRPCTPAGIVDWLEYNKYEFSGSNIVVIGRSAIVGKPLVNMLIDKGATVTCCNSKTSDLWFHTRRADIVISAIGKPKFFNAGWFSFTNDIVIDVGINRDENGKFCGDVDRDELFEAYGDGIYVTPVPGGVGLLTRLALMKNVYTAASRLQKRRRVDK